jgi:hypothetical protein
MCTFHTIFVEENLIDRMHNVHAIIVGRISVGWQEAS